MKLPEPMDNEYDYHTCPYLEELYDDYESLCTCGPEQIKQCAEDI